LSAVDAASQACPALRATAATVADITCMAMLLDLPDGTLVAAVVEKVIALMKDLEVSGLRYELR